MTDKVSDVVNSVKSGDIAGVASAVSGVINTTAHGAATAVTGAVSDMGSAVSQATGLQGFLDFFKNLFSANTAARFAAVVIGLILILAAIWALANAASSNGGGTGTPAVIPIPV